MKEAAPEGGSVDYQRTKSVEPRLPHGRRPLPAETQDYLDRVSVREPQTYNERVCAVLDEIRTAVDKLESIFPKPLDTNPRLGLSYLRVGANIAEQRIPFADKLTYRRLQKAAEEGPLRLSPEQLERLRETVAKAIDGDADAANGLNEYLFRPHVRRALRLPPLVWKLRNGG